MTQSPFLLFSALLVPGSFYEAIWRGESIGDGADAREAIRAYAALIPRDGSWSGDWHAFCAEPGADPHLLRYTSFEAFLDNEDALERIAVTGALLMEALKEERLEAANTPPAEAKLIDSIPLWGSGSEAAIPPQST